MLTKPGTVVDAGEISESHLYPIFFLIPKFCSKSFRSVDITLIVMDRRFTFLYSAFHSLMETSVSTLPVYVNVYHNTMD